MTTSNTVVMEDFIKGVLLGVESADAFVAKVRAMLEDPNAPNFVQPGTLCDCDCGRDLRGHLQDIVDDAGYAKFLFDMHIESLKVDYQEFIAKLIAGVTSVEELVAKATVMLNDRTSPDYIEEGVECDCDCGRDLRAHVQDIIDVPAHAARLLAPPKDMGDILYMLMTRLSAGGPGMIIEGKGGAPNLDEIFGRDPRRRGGRLFDD